MDTAIVQVLLGVISSGLFTLLYTPFGASSDRPTVVLDAIKQSLDGLLEVPEIDEAIGGERLRAFLQSTEVATLLRQVFAAEALSREGSLSRSRELFARLYDAHVSAGADRRVPDRLFDVMVDAACAALAAASGEGLFAAHDALDTLRHNVLMDALNGVERMLELLAGSGAVPDLKEIDDFAEDYRSQTVNRLGSITPPSFDALRVVPIDDLYVTPTLLLAQDRSNKPFAIRELSDFVKRLHRFVVLGSPGGGKSTLARKLCHDIALDRLQGELIPPGTLPVLIVLRDYGAAKRDRSVSVRDFVEERAHSDFQLDVPEGAMEYLLRAGRVLMVFDGLDELLDTSYRKDVTADIESFASLYPVTPILVTSRRVGYPEAPLDPARFETTTLGDFQPPQVKEYARKWFAVNPSETQRPLESEVSEFLADSGEVDDLRSNPLMLALMCNLYRGAGYIPRNRPEVYEKCAVMLFERWDRGRRIQVQLDFERHLRPALQHLAHWIYSQPDLQSGASERVLVQEAAAFLQRKRFPDEDEARAEAGRFVEFCRGRAWVFTDTGTTASGERLYEFTHRTFLEFFTAEHLVRTCRTPQALATELLPHIARAEWDIVAQLAFQLQDDNLEGAVDELLSALLAAAAEPNAEGRHQLLDFAARSLAFLVPEPTTLTNLTKQVVSEVLEQYDSANDSKIDGVQAFRTLARVNWENRMIVAEALREAVLEEAASQSPRVAALLEVGLHLDLVFPEDSDTPDLKQFWRDSALTTARAMAHTIEAAAQQDLNAAIDAISLRLLSPAQVGAYHQPEVFFRTRDFRVYPSRIRNSVSELLLCSASGPTERWMAVISPDPATLAEQLAQLGAVLRAAEPPWFATNTLFADLTYLIKGDRDTLGQVHGDTAFALVGLLGATLESAKYSSEAHFDEMLALLRDSALTWQQQLSPLAHRRFTRRDIDVDPLITDLRMAENASALTAEWAKGTTRFVEWASPDVVVDTDDYIQAGSAEDVGTDPAFFNGPPARIWTGRVSEHRRIPSDPTRDGARRTGKPAPGVRRAAARDVPRGARPDDRRDGAADDRRRPRRLEPHLVGGDRVPARADGGHAAVRQARRHVRAQDRAAERAGRVPRRLGAVRPEPEPRRADRLPRAAGPRRRRADGERAGGDRRRRAAARTGPLHGPVRRACSAWRASPGRCSAAS